MMKTTESSLVLDLRLTLGEGPFWDAESERLLFVDIPGTRLYRYHPTSGTVEEFFTKKEVGAVVTRESGGVMLARADGFVFFHVDRGEFVKISDPESDIDVNLFNDGKCDPSGRFWAGTMHRTFKPGAGSLYRLDTDGSVHTMARGFAIPNGIAWTGDRLTMYHVDSPTRQIFAWDYDDVTGAIANRRSVITVADDMGYPDGMSIDTEGLLWVALWGGSAVGCFDPRTGALTEKVTVPCTQPSACAFGGSELKDLYITTARDRLSAAVLEKEPTAGGLFVARPGATGVVSFAYKG